MSNSAYDAISAVKLITKLLPYISSKELREEALVFLKNYWGKKYDEMVNNKENKNEF